MSLSLSWNDSVKVDEQDTSTQQRLINKLEITRTRKTIQEKTDFLFPFDELWFDCDNKLNS